jgi:hypothetical protein
MCDEARLLSGAAGWTAYCDARDRAREHFGMTSPADRPAGTGLRMPMGTAPFAAPLREVGGVSASFREEAPRD